MNVHFREILLNRSCQFIFFSILIFFIIFRNTFFLQNDNRNIVEILSSPYYMSSDSLGYGNYKKSYLMQPWSYMLHPLYPVFVKLFTYGKSDQWKILNNEIAQLAPDDKNPASYIRIASENGLNRRLALMVYFQFFLYYFSVIFLYYSLVVKKTRRYLGSAAITGSAFCIALILFPPLITPRYIWTEGLAAPCLLIFCSCLIMYNNSKNMLYLGGMLLFAGFAYLIRPACVVLLPISGVYFLYFLIATRSYKKLSWYLLAAACYFPPLAYIAGLSILAGNIVVSPQIGSGNLVRASYYFTHDDIKELNDPHQKETMAMFVEGKSEYPSTYIQKYKKHLLVPEHYYKTEILDPLNPDDPFSHIVFLDSYWTEGYRKIINDYWVRFSNVPFYEFALYKIGKEVSDITVKNHLKEIIAVSVSIFIAALGLIPNPDLTPFLTIFGGKIFLLGFIISILLAIFYKPSRFLLIFFYFTYLTFTLLLAISQTIIIRYLAFNDILLEILIFLTLYYFFAFLYQRKKNWVKKQENLSSQMCPFYSASIFNWDALYNSAYEAAIRAGCRYAILNACDCVIPLDADGRRRSGEMRKAKPEVVDAGPDNVARMAFVFPPLGQALPARIHWRLPLSGKAKARLRGFNFLFAAFAAPEAPLFFAGFALSPHGGSGFRRSRGLSSKNR